MTETKSRKRQREIDQEITPTPSKIQKIQEQELSGLENITDAVAESKIFPFLTDQELGRLSQTSRLERGMTETKRAIRYEKMEREKQKILNSLKITQDYKQITRLIDDIWKIPFHQQYWNRPEIAENILDDIKYVDLFMTEAIENYLIQKFTIQDFNGLVSPNSYWFGWTLKNNNITEQEKVRILEKLEIEQPKKYSLEEEIENWINTTEPSADLPSQHLLVPYTVRLLKRVENDPKGEEIIIKIMKNFISENT